MAAFSEIIEKKIQKTKYATNYVKFIRGKISFFFYFNASLPVYLLVTLPPSLPPWKLETWKDETNIPIRLSLKPGVHAPIFVGRFFWGGLNFEFFKI